MALPTRTYITRSDICLPGRWVDLLTLDSGVKLSSPLQIISLAQNRCRSHIRIWSSGHIQELIPYVRGDPGLEMFFHGNSDSYDQLFVLREPLALFWDGFIANISWEGHTGKRRQKEHGRFFVKNLGRFRNSRMDLVDSGLPSPFVVSPRYNLFWMLWHHFENHRILIVALVVRNHLPCKSFGSPRRRARSNQTELTTAV